VKNFYWKVKVDCEVLTISLLLLMVVLIAGLVGIHAYFGYLSFEFWLGPVILFFSQALQANAIIMGELENP